MVSWNFNTIQRFWVLLAYFCFLWFLGTVNNILLHPLNNPLELLSYYWWRQRKLKVNTESRSVLSNSLRPHGQHSLWNSLGQNTGVDNLSLLHGIFPTQGSNPGSSALQEDSLPAEPQGKPNGQWLLTKKMVMYLVWELATLAHGSCENERNKQTTGEHVTRMPLKGLLEMQWWLSQPFGNSGWTD